MPTPRDPEEHQADVIDAVELARQRALALELRDTRLRHRLEREQEVKRKRERRAADLLRLADALASSGVSERDFVIRPQGTGPEADTSPSVSAPKRAKTE